MMQMVKHKQDPINAMILSKAGKTTARKTIITRERTRIIILANWRIASFVSPERLAVASGRDWTPQRTSIVDTRGRQLEFTSTISSPQTLRNERNSLQRYFCNRDNRNEHYHTNGKSVRVLGKHQYVGSDLIPDAISKHNPADDGHGAVKRVLFFATISEMTIRNRGFLLTVKRYVVQRLPAYLCGCLISRYILGNTECPPHGAWLW